MRPIVYCTFACGVVVKISNSKSRESGFKFSCLTEYFAIDSIGYVKE